MGITPGTDTVWYQHFIEPGVDNAVSGFKCHSTATYCRFRHCLPAVKIGSLWIGGGMAEGLHKKICFKTETCKFSNFLDCHGTCGILGTHRTGLWLTDGSRDYPLDPASPAHHLLRQGKPLARCWNRVLNLPELWILHAEHITGIMTQLPADNQIEAATGTIFIKKSYRRSCHWNFSAIRSGQFPVE